MRLDATLIDQAVAAKVRGALAEMRITGTELARRVDKPQRYVSRRVSGEVPWIVGELYQVADVLELPVSRFLPDGDSA